MANCPSCAGEVDERALLCPHCHAPIQGSKVIRAARPPDAIILGSSTPEEAGDFEVIEGSASNVAGETENVLVYAGTNDLIGPDAVLERTGDDPHPIPRTPYENFVLAAVDGNKTVLEIQRGSSLTPQEIMTACLTLIDKKLVQIRPPVVSEDEEAEGAAPFHADEPSVKLPDAGNPAEKPAAGVAGWDDLWSSVGGDEDLVPKEPPRLDGDLLLDLAGAPPTGPSPAAGSYASSPASSASQDLAADLSLELPDLPDDAAAPSEPPIEEEVSLSLSVSVAAESSAGTPGAGRSRIAAPPAPALPEIVSISGSDSDSDEPIPLPDLSIEALPDLSMDAGDLASMSTPAASSDLPRTGARSAGLPVARPRSVTNPGAAVLPAARPPAATTNPGAVLPAARPPAATTNPGAVLPAARPPAATTNPGAVLPAARPPAATTNPGAVLPAARPPAAQTNPGSVLPAARLPAARQGSSVSVPPRSQSTVAPLPSMEVDPLLEAARSTSLPPTAVPPRRASSLIDAPLQAPPPPKPAAGPVQPEVRVENYRASKLVQAALRDRERGNLVSAQMNMKLALSFDPNNPEYKKLYKELLYGEKKAAPAPQQEKDLQDLVTDAERSGKLDEAIRLLEEAIAKNKKDAPALNRLGVILGTKKGQLNKASDLIERALEIEPDNANYAHNLTKIIQLIDQRAAKSAPRPLPSSKPPEAASVELSLPDLPDLPPEPPKRGGVLGSLFGRKK